MISTVLRNLISNAIKFTYPGGRIDIFVDHKDKEFIVSVCDNGVGMTEETTDRLFRIDNNISFKGAMNEKGTGLGLILCKEFVEKHGGKVWVDSLPGNGGNIHFTLLKYLKIDANFYIRAKLSCNLNNSLNNTGYNQKIKK